MKLAVLSDIHGNLEALGAVLGDMETTRPHRVVSLGDNIGYGPDSQAVMEILMEMEIPSILGNHEMVIKHPRFMKWFNPTAQKAVELARQSLSPQSIQRIATFETHMLIQDQVRLVHGLPPDSPFLYLFQISPSALVRRIQNMAEPICFAGHTHDLEIFHAQNGELVNRKLKERHLRLEPEKNYIINAGAVGQPQDGEPSAKYLLFDSRSLEIEIRHCTYDFHTTRKKIQAAGIPSLYGEKLGIHFRNEE
ncbi:MAG: metallophosphoesterase family protein [Desulfobacterales bacterium]|nr:metallophosphoesterase family protein [Desulfobacterales bacterium]